MQPESWPHSGSAFRPLRGGRLGFRPTLAIQRGTMNRLEVVAIRHPLRIQLLNALADGKSVALATYAKALDLPLPLVTYHCEALAGAGAVSLEDGTARITESGKELHRIAQKPERRQKPDRRRNDRQDRRRD